MVLKRIGQSANAWWALGALGRQAQPAIPEVYRIALESPSTDVVPRALAFLSQMGPDGVPALMEVVAHGKGERRATAMCFIGQMPNLGTNGPVVVAMLLKCMEEKDEVMAAAAASALGEVALDTKRVVPALTARLRDGRLAVRCGAARALGNLANNRAAIPDFRGAVPELVIAQRDPDSVVREWVTNVLWKVAPEVLTNEQLK
jgi:HEAT repeat protein